ncbi:phage head closure protein [Celeribacter indicus]|nr:phage head closure protein [Celeribacter indicus]SDW00293.1 phage head-tail adaptor, putative, SPP1 family [Celeribacter indicus]
MRHKIEIRAVAVEPNEFGTPVESSQASKILRAEVVQQTTEEFIRAQGALDETLILFRVRNPGGVTTSMRVIYRGDTYGIREIVPIENERGLELRCRKSGGQP